MIDPGAGFGLRGRVLLVLLVCLALPLVGGCSSDPECLAAPYLPQCFDDDEENTKDTATQTRVRGPARAEDIDTIMAALRHALVGTDVATVGKMHRQSYPSSVRRRRSAPTSVHQTRAGLGPQHASMASPGAGDPSGPAPSGAARAGWRGRVRVAPLRGGASLLAWTRPGDAGADAVITASHVRKHSAYT